MVKNLKEFLITILSVLFVVGGVLLAGTITPPGDNPSATSYTLNDIYNKLYYPDFTYSPHSLSPSVPTSATTMRTLAEIYNITPSFKVLSDSTTTMSAGVYATTTLTNVESDLTAGNIASGVEIFGVTGTY